MPAAQKIYLVEDEALIVMELADRLARLGYEICGQAARGEQALEQIPLIGPDLVLMDIRLAGALTGLETAARLRPLLAVPVVFLSAFADSEMIDAAVCAGAFGYLTKPFEERELHATLQAALYRHKLERLQHEEKHRLEAMVRERTAELEAERRRLACIIEGTDSGTWEWNVQTGETVFNERWAEIIGYRLEELAPVSIQTWLTLAHPEDLARSNDILQRHFAGGLSHYDCECRMRHKDGRWIWVHDRGRVITRTEDGRPLMMYGSHMDVSARKEAETTYLRRTAELKEAQRIGQIGNWHLELATNQVVWSEELYRQYAADPTIPPPPYTEHRKFFTPESWERLSTALTHTCDTGIPYTLELQTVRTDGSNGWMWVRGEREVDADGNVVGIAGVAQDISARKAAEEALRLSEESLAITLSSIGDGVLATDLHGRVVRLNPEAERLTGWTQTEAAGHPVCDIFNIINEYTRQPQVIPVDEVLRTGRRVDLANHTILIARDGAERPIADSAAPIRDEAGTIRGVVLVFRDQTAELAAQRALRERERLLSSINQNLPGCFVYRVGFSP
jgi:PAS domain S-box-containing protein